MSWMSRGPRRMDLHVSAPTPLSKKREAQMAQSNLDLSKEFAGRRALVTGGSRGIGAAVARRLIDAGARVVVTARARHAETPADATFVQGDLRTEAGAKAIG